MIKLTKTKALQIQAEQVEHYAAMCGDFVRDIVTQATRASTLPEGEHDVVLINRHIPRGGHIEYLIVKHRENVAQASIKRIGARIPPLPAARTPDPSCPTTAPFLFAQAAIEIAVASRSRHIDMSRTFFQMADPGGEAEPRERAAHQRFLQDVGPEIVVLEAASFIVRRDFIVAEEDDFSCGFD